MNNPLLPHRAAASYNGLATVYPSTETLALKQTAWVLAAGNPSDLLLRNGAINRLKLLPNGSFWDNMLGIIDLLRPFALHPEEQDRIVLEHFSWLASQRQTTQPASAATRAANTARLLESLRKEPRT